MEIKFLKAGSGDSILIQHNGRNILVDGGNESSFLLQQAALIHQKEEFLDLVVITHHDDDHIRGIIDLLKQTVDKVYGVGFIKRILFNSPRTIKKSLSNEGPSTLLSYRQARKVEDLLTQLKLVPELCTEDSVDYDAGNGLVMRFLSPREEDNVEYANDPGALLSSDSRCDWEYSFQFLDDVLTDRSQDQSLFNRSSIVIVVQCEDKKVLLAGDATPDRLLVILDQLQAENEGNVPKFDLVKLPHHGSSRSLSAALLKKMHCREFLISTNARKHFLPNKKGLLKVLKHTERHESEPITFLFNYPEPIKHLQIKEREFQKYRFSVKANNENYGYVFR